MAKEMKVDTSTVLKWENGERVPSVPNCLKLAEVAGRDVREVVLLAALGESDARVAPA